MADRVRLHEFLEPVNPVAAARTARARQPQPPMQGYFRAGSGVFSRA
jgi:hypothetical protein